MAGSLSKNYLLQLGDSTASPAVYVTVPCQGDLTFNTGKTLEISRTKNCKNPFFREAGYTATTTVEMETPTSATMTLILDSADNEVLVDAKVTTTDSGLPIWTGEAYVAYDPLEAPTEGISTVNIIVAWVDDHIRHQADIAAFALKTPIPLLLASIGATLAWAAGRGPGRREYCLYVPVLIVFASNSLFNSLQIGVRHVLPVYPLLFVGVSPCVVHGLTRVLAGLRARRVSRE